MNSLIIYLVKSFLCTGVLTTLYYFLLRNKNCHGYNRFFLLATVIASLTLPVVSIHYTWLPFLHIDGVGKDLRNNSASAGNGQYFFVFGYFLVSIVCSGKIVSDLRRLYRLKKNGRLIPAQGFNLIETSSEQAPFTFFNNLFWRVDISREDVPGKNILLHELAHIRGYHSIDKLFTQIVSAIFWINPLFRYIHHELNMVHEFIADKGIPGGDTASFAEMLLLSLYPSQMDFQTSHGFFQSPVRRRLQMIDTNKDHTAASWRKMILFPLLLLLTVFITASAAPTASTKEVNREHQQKLKDEQAALNS